MSAWLETRVARRREWAPGLVSLTLADPMGDFEAGQWANIALEVDGARERRAYSLASPPGAPAELYVALVPGGRFTPRLFELEAGAPIEIERQPQGFFTARWLPEAKDLWLVATGTGLAPYLSMLRSGALESFDRVVLVHGVRQASHLGYREELEARVRQSDGHLSYVPVVSREPDAAGVLHGRITGLIASGELERAAGIQLSPDASHLMLCGNPQMIEEASSLLAERGLLKHRQRKPGHVTVESYW